MSNLITVFTRLEHPKVFLTQGKDLQEVIRCTKLDPHLQTQRGWVFEFKPHPRHENNLFGGLRLNLVYQTDNRSMFEACLQEALHYARRGSPEQMGFASESQMLLQTAQRLINAAKEARAIEEKNQGETSSGEVRE